ncbi:MAG: peptidase [Enterobacter sp.]|nr:peptidase [Enterobacter sp.]
MFPPTELTGAGALLELVQPASQSETSDNAATRLMVNLGLQIYRDGTNLSRHTIR